MLIKEFFSSAMGILSLAIIVLLIAMSVYLHWWIKRKIDESEKQSNELDSEQQ